MTIEAETSDRDTEVERVVATIQFCNLGPGHFGPVLEQPHDDGDAAKHPVRDQNDRTGGRLRCERRFTLIHLRCRQFR